MFIVTEYAALSTKKCDDPRLSVLTGNRTWINKLEPLTSVNYKQLEIFRKGYSHYKSVGATCFRCLANLNPRELIMIGRLYPF